jgi:TonB family protein
MRSLFQNESSDSRQVGGVAWISIGVHAIVLALIVVGTLHVRRTIVFRPMMQGSVTHVSAIAISQGALAAAITPKAAAAPKTTPRLRLVPKPKLLPAKSNTALPTPPEPPSSASSAAQASTQKSISTANGPGSDAQSMYPAYPIVSPSPQVKDRSLLPPTDRRVIVDVNLGTDGQVQQATLVSGLGNSLDQLVIDTVRGWQFHPAMLNGNPVPSSIELVFPFNRNYPMAE